MEVSVLPSVQRRKQNRKKKHRSKEKKRQQAAIRNETTTSLVIDGDDDDGATGTTTHHDYIAIIDTDEFIVFPNHQSPQQQQQQASSPLKEEEEEEVQATTTNDHGLSTIHDLLDKYLIPFVEKDNDGDDDDEGDSGYNNAGALAINWMYYGNANKSIYTPLPVLKRFQYRDLNYSNIIKTIVKADTFRYVRNPHSVKLSKGKVYVDTMNNIPGNIANLSKAGASNYNSMPVYDNDDVLSLPPVVLNHYRFMSNKEYLVKRCVRQAINGLYRGCSKVDGNSISNEGVVKHSWPRSGTVFDDTAWKFFISKVPKYSIYDNDNDDWKDYT